MSEAEGCCVPFDTARADLVARGVDVSEAFHDVTGIFHRAGAEGRASGPAPEHADYGSFAAFSDPDGNGWLLQETYWACIPSKTLLRPGEAVNGAREATASAAVDVEAALAWRDFMVSDYSDSGQERWLAELADTIQPFPTFSEIYVAALKALLGEIAAASKAVGAEPPLAS